MEQMVFREKLPHRQSLGSTGGKYEGATLEIAAMANVVHCFTVWLLCVCILLSD